MISTSDFRTGLTIEVDGEIVTVLDFQHVKPGKGAAFVRTKLKNLETGAVVEKTFRAGEKVKRAHVDRKQMQYLYHDGENLVFMDVETFEQFLIHQDNLLEARKYLKENMSLTVLLYKEKTIGAELPPAVELKVTKTDPGLKGDTATGGTKPAVLETGVNVQVPLFIEEGDIIKIDTRSGEYVERV